MPNQNNSNTNPQDQTDDQSLNVVTNNSNPSSPQDQIVDNTDSTLPPVSSIQPDIPPMPDFNDTQSTNTVTNVVSDTASETVTDQSPNSSDFFPPVTPSKPKKTFGTPKIIATILGFVLLVGGITAGVVLTQQSQLFKQKAIYCSPPCGAGTYCNTQYGECLPIPTSPPGGGGGGGGCQDNPPSCTVGVTCGTITNCAGSVNCGVCPLGMSCGSVQNNLCSPNAVTCTPGQTSSCTIDSCAATQTCLATADGKGSWGSCVKTDPNCGNPGSCGTYPNGSTRVCSQSGISGTETCTNGVWGNCLSGGVGTDGTPCVDNSQCSTKYPVYVCSSKGTCVPSDPLGAPISCNAPDFPYDKNGGTCDKVNTVSEPCLGGGYIIEAVCTGNCIYGTATAGGKTGCWCALDNRNCKGNTNYSTPPPSPTPTPTPSPTPSPTPGPTAVCSGVKAYSTTWIELTATDLSGLKAGESVNFCVAGTLTGAGTFDMARFTINGTQEAQTTIKRPTTNDFCQAYTIPSGVYSFDVTAQIHHVTLGWVGP